MKIKTILTVISALAMLAGAAGSAHAQNKVANGDFSANAAAFTVVPGGVGNTDGTATNPPIASWTTYPDPNDPGKGINGAGTPLGNIFGPADPGGRTFAFAQNGGTAMYQLLSLAPNTSYLLSIDIAGRAADVAPLFSVEFADATDPFNPFWVNAGYGATLPASQGAFTHYTLQFTTPSTGLGSGALIELWNRSGAGDNTVVFANVAVMPVSQLIVNGDFTANAAVFTTWPGMTTQPGNPANIAYWVNALGGGKGVNGAAVGFAGSPFGPLDAGGRTYAVIQGGVAALTQELPVTYTPGTVYQLNFEAAARNGNSAVDFRVQIGDTTQEHFTTQVGGVELVGNPAAFTPYTYIFTAPPTFDGPPSIQLYNLTAGDNTINFANVSLQVATNAVLISQQPTPAALSKYVGGTATFTAAAVGTNTVFYQWRHAGTNLSDAGKFSGTTTTTLVIDNLSAAEAGAYDVVASVGPNAVTSQTATLTVLPPGFILQPQSLTLYAGRTASFTATAEGPGSPSYRWRKNGSNLSDGGKFSGTGTTNLVITNVSTGEADSYDVVATFTGSSVPSSAATLAAVTLPVAGTYPAAILSHNPMGYWRFSDGGGTNAFDYIAGNNAFDPLGSPLQAGPQPPDFGGFESLNSAPHLNGTNQGYASTSQLFNGLSEFTLMGWFNIDPSQYPFSLNAAGRASLFGQQWTAELSFYQGTNLYFYAQGITATIFVTSGFDPGVWHFVAAVSDPTAGATTVYLDGVVAGVGSVCPGAVLPYHFSIGDYVSNFPNVPSPFPGSIDEVAAFDHALSEADVQSLYKAATPVVLQVGRSGTNLELKWSQGTLLQADAITGPWTTNTASSPYLVAPVGAKKFYRVQVQ